MESTPSTRPLSKPFWFTIAKISPNLGGLTFNYTWDMCADSVPDGPVSVALSVTDQQGNQASVLDVRHVVKEFSCAPPPPACEPASGEVALFSEQNYGGSCQVFQSLADISAYVGHDLRKMLAADMVPH